MISRPTPVPHARRHRRMYRNHTHVRVPIGYNEHTMSDYILLWGIAILVLWTIIRHP